MAEAELFDGTVLEFPDGTSPEVIARVAKAQTAERRSRVGSPAADAVTPKAQTPGLIEQGVNAARAVLPGARVPEEVKPRSVMDAILDTAGGAVTQFGRGARRGLASLAGAPVDIVNNAPRVLNLLPGVDNVGPITPHPIGGSESIDRAMGGFGLIPEAPAPRNAIERVAGRIGQEVGANALPVAGVVGIGNAMGRQAARRMAVAPPTIAPPSSIPGAQVVQQQFNNLTNAGKSLTGSALEAGAVAPRAVAVREGAYAGAAGTGAGVVNELAGNPQSGDNFWSDFIGSMTGVGALSTAGAVAGPVKRIAGTVLGRPSMTSDTVGEEVANRIINNSTQAGEQFANTGTVDTTPLVTQLRRPSPVEEAIPGYRANIGDRTQDPQIATFAFNQDARMPGAANERRVGNEVAVDSRMTGLDPGGDAAQFRAALEANRTQQLGQVDEAARAAEAAAAEASQAVQPGMRDATARGASMREALADRYAQEQQGVREAYAPVNEATVQVDAAPLADRFGAVTEGLPINDRQRFLPSEANVPAQLVEPAVPPSASPILDVSGQPFVRPGTPATGEVPLREITSLRSGLTDDIRAAKSTPGQAQKARVANQFRDEVDQFVEGNVPPELRDQFDAARAARRDVADRFERPGTGIAETLKPREGGGYALDDSAVTQRFTPTDQGRVNDFQSVMREVGSDPRARNAIADEIMSDVNARGLTDRPDQLRKYLGERNIVLEAFPELRDKMVGAATAREGASTARTTADETTRRLTTPSRSAQANYLQHGDEAVVNAVRGVTAGPRPREAARELVDAAGGSPEVLRNARSALWEVVKQQKLSAPGITGNDRWSGRKLKAMFDDPKTNAVAEELWRDNPGDLEDIKKVFTALDGADGSMRARAAGSSGTAQALTGKLDPSLTATGIASRARSVERGQLSPTIAGVDLLSTYLRNKSKQIQARAIDTLTSSAVNNPGLAADLLEKFNPIEYAAKRRMISQKYGVRATQLLNLLDDAQAPDDEVGDAIRRPLEVDVKKRPN
ncbi:hypothetical protein [Bosea lathyri]|uniref:Uncharacterized protein n=1 Tax=Bosea lathyri TaxID=1036778 RepID=A0A1H6BWH1_9HYPH|nr:hypothetical protein [Bosea lathyri]SEG65048.1 hypothetical protein SAMN04488115_108147 [Bosea lathyri]